MKLKKSRRGKSMSSKHRDIFDKIDPWYRNRTVPFLPLVKPQGQQGIANSPKTCFYLRRSWQVYVSLTFLGDIWLLAYSLRQKLLIASAKNRAIAYSLRQNTIVYSLRRKLLIATAKRKAYLRIVFMLSDVRGCLYYAKSRYAT